MVRDFAGGRSTAVARKLVTIANALCKSGQKWTAAEA
jgi:hypothetical protein